MKAASIRVEDLYRRLTGASIRQREGRERPVEQLTPQEVEQIEEEGAVIKPEVPPETKPDCMRIDLHCHSEASPDSSSPFDEIPPRCVEKGITVQAITDHNCIWGAQQLQESVRDPWGSAAQHYCRGGDQHYRRGVDRPVFE